MAHSVKTSRWALSVPVGVVTSFGAGLVLNAVVGAAQPIAEWQTNVGGAVVVLVGTLATGTVAGAQTAREWVQAAIWTFAGLLAVAVVVFIYAVAMEPPR
jgi:hypothetical protein